MKEEKPDFSKAGMAKKAKAWLVITKLHDTYRCRGRIKAEGKKAKPSFCIRARGEGSGSGRKTVLEIHSKVTGKQIGWLGEKDHAFSKTKAEARVWDYLNGAYAEGEFRYLLHDASRKSSLPWNKTARQVLKEMTREARKS